MEIGDGDFDEARGEIATQARGEKVASAWAKGSDFAQTARGTCLLIHQKCFAAFFESV